MLDDYSQLAEYPHSLLPNEWKQVKYGQGKKVTNIAKHMDNECTDFLIDTGSDAHRVPVGMFDAPIIPRDNGRKVVLS